MYGRPGMRRERIETDQAFFAERHRAAAVRAAAQPAHGPGRWPRTWASTSTAGERIPSGSSPWSGPRARGPRPPSPRRRSPPAGLRVGTLTSPGLRSNRERIRVDGAAIARPDYEALVGRVASTLRAGVGLASPTTATSPRAASSPSARCATSPTAAATRWCWRRGWAAPPTRSRWSHPRWWWSPPSSPSTWASSATAWPRSPPRRRGWSPTRRATWSPPPRRTPRPDCRDRRGGASPRVRRITPGAAPPARGRCGSGGLGARPRRPSTPASAWPPPTACSRLEGRRHPAPAVLAEVLARASACRAA